MFSITYSFNHFIGISSYSLLVLLLGFSLGYDGFNGPSPDLGSCEKGSIFRKYILSPVFRIWSPFDWAYGKIGSGGGTSITSLFYL